MYIAGGGSLGSVANSRSGSGTDSESGRGSGSAASNEPAQKRATSQNATPRSDRERYLKRVAMAGVKKLGGGE